MRFFKKFLEDYQHWSISCKVENVLFQPGVAIQACIPA
jgi:hypothetical protein